MKNYLICFAKGILAGLAIGLGGFLYILMTFLFKGDLEFIGHLIGSVLFAVGLMLVCSFSLNLYTGKIGLIYEERKDKDFYISLPIILVGNAIGAFLLGYICYLIFKDTDLFAYAEAAANSRLVFDHFSNYLNTIIGSFLCGLCVYLAVMSFSLNRLKPLGVTLLVFFVFFFVFCRFQHCIANMFYFGFANKITGYTFLNLALVIIFNTLGPVVGVAFVKLIKKNS